MSDWNFAAVWDGIADIVPERDAIVGGGRRISWREFSERATRLGWHLEREAGVTPGDRIAIGLTNRPEYLETFYAALKVGGVPCNVNFRYTANEVHHLLDTSDAKVFVHGPALAKAAKTAAKRIPKPWRPLLLEAGEPYERVLAASAPALEWVPRRPRGDDLVFLYTGGTTGNPKAVMWRNDDLYVALWASGHPTTPDPPDPHVNARDGKRAATVLPVAPLMHGTGLFAALATLSGSGTVVLVDQPGLDPELVWDTVEREQVATLTLVGDVFARPLLDALRAAPTRWNLSSLRTVTSSGVLFSPSVKRGLLDLLPHMTIVDALGASEGLGPRQASRDDHAEIHPARFRVNEWIRVIDEDTGRDVVPGSGEVGMLAIGGRIPVGYFNEPARTAATFRIFDGVRYSVPGDFATIEADGTIKLLGRGSASINTGGEKVFAEEVEGLLRKHPSVFDCAVVGVPDARYGDRVVALVQVTERHYLDAAELAAWCRSRLAGFKIPHRFLFVDSVRRSAAGKVNHHELREIAISLLAEGPPA